MHNVFFLGGGWGFAGAVLVLVFSGSVVVISVWMVLCRLVVVVVGIFSCPAATVLEGSTRRQGSGISL